MSTEPGRIVLALNAGSSSLKFGLYRIDGDTTALARGAIKRSQGGAEIQAQGAGGETFAHRLAPAMVEDDVLLDHMLDWLAKTFGRGEPSAIGHRIVHGGARFAGPVLLTPDAIEAADALTPMAPLHQPAALSLVRAVSRIRPDLPQVGCFDTAFHHHLAPPVSRYGLPRAYEQKGIRRYGFHGLSYEYIAGELGGSGQRVVVAHLGSGASLCALRNGRSQDTTMGFSALDGLVMSTRPGQIDAGILLYLLRQEKLTPEALEHLLYHESGLKGVSGISGDVRQLLDSDAPEAAEALDLFVFRIARETAAIANTMEGLDSFVFTGGIGEHSAPIRQRVAERLAWLGVSLDTAANASGARCISARDSRVNVLVIPTDEEVVIARNMAIVLGAAPR